MDITRFRSFAERYVIERASTFKGDKEMEDAWSAVERAKSIYKHIERVAIVENDRDLQEMSRQNQGATTQGPVGATGMFGPKGPTNLPYAAPSSAQQKAPMTLGQTIKAIALGKKSP